MIKPSGHLENEKPKAIAAAQRILFEKGYKWLSVGKEVAHTKFGNLAWKHEFLTFTSSNLTLPGDLHKMSDFGLDENGNPLPTFGNLKAGDPNPFVSGQDVKVKGASGVVCDVYPGPYISVDHGRSIEWYGWGYNRAFVGNINDVIPVVRTATKEQPAPHEYDYKQKVKVKGWKQPCAFISCGFGRISVISYDSVSQLDGPNAVQIHSLPESHVSPWTEPVTIYLYDDYDLVILDDGTGADVRLEDMWNGHISPEAMDELTAAWLKIRGNE